MTVKSPVWTIGVYLAGGDNVSREMMLSLHDIRDVAVAKRSPVRALVQFEPGAKAPRMFAFDGVARASIGAFRAATPRGTPDPMGLASYEYVLDEPSRGPAGASARLGSFASSARDYAAGGPLMLVVSGHANGAVGELLGHRGEEPLFLPDLRVALEGAARGGKLDVLGLDCCNMSMVEVGFELAPHARFMVGSEGYILNHGWPYRPILEAIEGRDAEAAAVEAAREYADNYSDYGLLDVSSHCAVLRLEEIEALAAPARRLAERMLGTLDDPDVWRPAVLAHWEAQSFKDEEYVDLADFCSRLRTHVADGEIASACTDVIAAVRRVVAFNRVNGSAFQYATGLSVYFPWCHDLVKKSDRGGGPSDLERYGQLAFARETRWAELIDAYLVATRREPPSRGRSDLDLYDPPRQLVHEQSSSQEKERHMAMQRPPSTQSPSETPAEGSQLAVRRAPPWSSKGGAQRTPSIKNHPGDAPAEGSQLAVRRAPPWSSKGGAQRTPSIKNHPSDPPAEGSQLAVRRAPPWSSKGSAVAGRPTVKNHPAKS